MTVPSLPPALVRTLLDLHGEAGAAWLQGLPALLERLRARWRLRIDAPFPNLSYHLVLRAWGPDGDALVLKVGVPHREFTREIEALRLYDGAGCVRLAAADPEAAALLEERVRPGTPLARLEDDEAATRVAARVMRRLRRPLPAGHPFPTVADWGAGLQRLREAFGGGTGPFPAPRVEAAERWYAEHSGSEGVLLHGDLHHENVLQTADGEWRAIDPKGLAGPAEYEVGALLRNRLPSVPADWPRVLDRRIRLLAEELGADPALLRGWSEAQAVLSGWWAYEDHGHGWEEALAVAEALAGLRP